jgi:erythromycin esterase-like protein
MLLIVFASSANAQEEISALAPAKEPADDVSLLELIQDVYKPFTDIESANLDGLLKRIGEARVVLLGEASHGTREFYLIRERINLGQLVREAFGHSSYLIGFSTDHGMVAAAPWRNRPVRFPKVPHSHKDSYEHLFHQT